MAAASIWLRPKEEVIVIQVSTSDRDEAITAVSRVYCPHQLRLDKRTAAATTRLRADVSHGFAHVGLEYGATADVDASDLKDLILVMHAVRGTASVRQPGRERRWIAGQTVAVTGDQPTRFSFDAIFMQTSLRLDPADVRAHCEKLLGTSLDANVRFDLQSFSPDLEVSWSQIMTMSSNRRALSSSGLGYLQQLAMDLLLHRHPHNYSHLLGFRDRPVAGLAAEAVALIDSLPEYELLHVADVAARLQVSARSLERAFREAFDVSPAQYLRSKRLNRVRRMLEEADRGTSVTDIASAHGFYHPGRFARYYRQRFGESPSATLARN
ncbi:AraC family transcriptional regulator [Paenarthrobacter sp. OM7]|uniref:AraC family transcriptional regulator n=1 Tax=Paenarthrobacter sp. AMU7 TaxID=3162492 RepID=A0AB39YNH7_9MICC|nr:AraC family transcriptional regulator [Paenarthrobacter sp. OM7]WGM20431.1 AraC family transcriptional regulator [Paenarthrobacter sp. OM7]